ncbi:enoyl-CoA hydratase-related protein [Nocardioides plantarum]|uniref:Enoyl-CoA hydratase-related protein n=1 Tax=Nocardioides plantarum TaxID=29299 RepID=A0ABV5K9Q1_9ACTN|nr:enoyl-CoA hydratase-related protein [Nocardioides plantarum]
MPDATSPPALADPAAHVRVDEADGVLTLTMDRPEVLNAMSAEMSLALAEQLERAHTDDAVRVVVLTGAGDAFGTGADIGGLDAHERFDVRAMDVTSRMVRAIVGCDKPVLAAVNGIAAGVSCSLALACDVIVARESAAFLLPFARIGFMVDGGASATVAAAVGRARAMRMGLLAEPLAAQEAYDAGLVTHLAAAPDADGASYDDLVATLTRRLAAGAPLAQAATKRAINAATLAHLDTALDRERTGQTFLMRTDDVAEGMRAFSERRKAVFRGE